MIEFNGSSLYFFSVSFELHELSSMKTEKFLFLKVLGFFLLLSAWDSGSFSSYSTIHFDLGWMYCVELHIKVAKFVSSIYSSSLISCVSSCGILSKIHLELVIVMLAPNYVCSDYYGIIVCVICF